MGNSLGGFDTLFMPVGRTDAQAAHAYVKKPIGIPEYKQYCNSKLP